MSMTKAIWRIAVVLFEAFVLCFSGSVACADEAMLTRSQVSEFISTTQAKGQICVLSEMTGINVSCDDGQLSLGSPTKVHYVHYADDGTQVQRFSDIGDYVWAVSVSADGKPIGSAIVWDNAGHLEIGSFGGAKEDVEEASLFPQISKDETLIHDMAYGALFKANSSRVTAINSEAKALLPQSVPLMTVDRILPKDVSVADAGDASDGGAGGSDYISTKPSAALIDWGVLALVVAAVAVCAVAGLRRSQDGQ